MVSPELIEKQLKKLGFNIRGWGKSEARELPHILLPDEQIYECVNGFYEAGFALLVATDIRVLLVDKKPMNYLTVEDLRFDMISEIDYSHRLLGAQINISTGSKNLKFTSYNQPRLRKLITHVQHCMAESKKEVSEHQEEQKNHLQKINQQLQTYLVAQQQHQDELHRQLQESRSTNSSQQVNQLTAAQSVPRPSPELADYLYAQGLLAQYANQSSQVTVEPAAIKSDLEHKLNQVVQVPAPLPTPQSVSFNPNPSQEDLYAEGWQEVYGKHQQNIGQPQVQSAVQPQTTLQPTDDNQLDINPLRIAYSKLPIALRNRRFGRPSFHAHSQAAELVPSQATAQAPSNV